MTVTANTTFDTSVPISINRQNVTNFINIINLMSVCPSFMRIGNEEYFSCCDSIYVVTWKDRKVVKIELEITQ